MCLPQPKDFSKLWYLTILEVTLLHLRKSKLKILLNSCIMQGYKSANFAYLLSLMNHYLSWFISFVSTLTYC